MKQILLFFFITIVFLTLTAPVRAGFYIFDPATISAKKGDQVTVKVQIDTGGELVKTAESIILYDGSQLRFVKVDFPTGADRFFSQPLKNIKENKINIGGSIKVNEEPVKGVGQIGTITFEALGSGKNEVTFYCEQGKTVDSNINKRGATGLPQDIVECNKNNSFVVTIGGTGGGTGPAPTSLFPTGGQGATLTPKLSVKPSATPLLTSRPSETPRPSAPLITNTPTPNVTITSTSSASLTATPVPTAGTLPDTGSTTIANSIMIAGGILITLSILLKVLIFKI